MGLFFNRKKKKKSSKADDASVGQPNLDVLAPLDLTDAIDEPVEDKKLSRREQRKAKKLSKEQEPDLQPLDLTQEEEQAPVDEPPVPMQVAEERPVVPPVKLESTGDPTRDAMAQKFAELRQVVAQKRSDEAFAARQQAAVTPVVEEENEPAPVKDEPLELKAVPTEPAPEPLVDEEQESHAEESAAIAMGSRRQMDDAWLGLWIAEDGRAIIVEEGDPGDYFVTAMPDPMSKCYSGPDFPEIETWRMPGHYVRDLIGDVEGERLVVNSVPGLPEEHKAPEIYLYFLTKDEAHEGENRFAQRGDKTRSIFLVTDSEPGTVNPWGEGDHIDWLGEPASFYKAPEKLDVYIDKRLRKSDPSNYVE